MINRNKAVLSLALTGLYVLAAPAAAAVRERLDYSDATRVRHDVTAIERRTVGYTLKISTSIYGEAEGDAIRAYAATCIVNGANQPLSFDIDQSR
jgi:hypothetical protein